MATLIIHDLDDDLILRLLAQAARHGRSMETEALSILRDALQCDPPNSQPTAGSIRTKIEPLGGDEP